MSLLFLDTETTGLEVDKVDLIELSAVRIENGKITKKFDSLVKPFSDIPAEIEELTGISNADVVSAPSLDEVRRKFLEEFISPDDILIAHNVAFDLSMLNAKEFDLDLPTLDTFDLARIVFPKSSSYALEYLSAKLNIKHKDAHRAMADVLAMIEVWKEMQKKVSEEWKAENIALAQKITNKSDWAGKVFFEGLKAKNKETGQMSLFSSTLAPTETQDFDEEEVLEILRGHEKSAFITSPKKNLPRICLQIARKLNGQTAICANQNMGLPVLDKAENFVSPEKIAEFKERNDISTQEAIVFLRILGSEAKHIGDLVLYGEEKEVFYREFSSSEREETQENLVYLPFENIKNFNGDNLLIADADNLDEKLTQSQKEYSSSRYFEKLKAKTQEDAKFLDGLFFGFALIKRYVMGEKEDGVYAETVVLDDNNEQIDNFASGFSEASKEMARLFPDDIFLLEEMEKWINFFSASSKENEVKSLTAFPDGTVIFSISPISFGDIFKAKKTALFAHKLDSNPENGKLGFPFHDESFFVHKDKISAENSFFISLDNENNTVPEKIAEQIIEFSSGGKLSLVAILASVSMVLEVSEILKEKKIPFLSHSRGNSAKTAIQYKKGVVLVPFRQTENLLNEIENPFDIYYLQKLTFDPPNNPLLEKRKMFFQNNEFMSFALPRAISRFLSIFNLAYKKSEKFAFVCADSKLSKMWAKHFLTALPENLPKRFLNAEKAKMQIDDFLA